MSDSGTRQRRVFLSNLRLICVAFIAISALSTAQAITVTTAADSGAGSLRQALAETPSGGTVDFETALNGSTIVLSTELRIVGKELRIIGPGTEQLSISGNRTCRVFSIDNTSSVSISALTIRNGFDNWRGGGILSSGTLTLSNCVIRDNRVESTNENRGGAGLYATTGNILIQDSTITSNMLSVSQSSSEGYDLNGSGARLSGDSVTVRDTVFSGNASVTLADSEDRIDGVGLHLTGSPSLLERCTFEGNVGINEAPAGQVRIFGSAAFVRAYTPNPAPITFMACRFIGQRATFPNYDGSASVFCVADLRSTLTLERCLFNGNDAGNAILAYGSNSQGYLILSNSTITGNDFGNSPAVRLPMNVQTHSTPLTVLSHCTIASNSVTAGSTIDFESGSGLSQIKASVVTNNARTSATYELQGYFESNGYNYVGSLHPSVNPALFAAPGDTIGNAPMLGTAVDNGGPTMTMMPLAGSPLIDTIPFDKRLADEDQRGMPRPMGLGSDIGACEAAPYRAVFHPNQQVAIGADELFWAGAWNYSDAAWSSTLEANASSTMSFGIVPSNWTSLYIYNYAASAWLEGDHVYRE